MRASLITATLTAFLLLTSPVAAQVTAPDSVVDAIEADGYTITKIARSWLGRTVITARNANGLREVVLNRQSGEVLRDQTFRNDQLNRLAPRQGPFGKPGAPGPGGPGGGGRGPGGPGR